MASLGGLVWRILLAVARAARDPERHRFETETGDPELVFRRYFEEVYRYCRQRLPSSADAEDVAAQVFAEATAKLPQLKWKGRPVLAFLYTVAGNRIADHHRAAGRRPAETLDTAPEPVAAAPSLDVLVGHGVLGDAIAELPEDQRLAVYLQLVRGYSFAEVARIVGRTEKACKGLVYRGLEALRERLAAEGVTP